MELKKPSASIILRGDKIITMTFSDDDAEAIIRSKAKALACVNHHKWDLQRIARACLELM